MSEILIDVSYLAQLEESVKRARHLRTLRLSRAIEGCAAEIAELTERSAPEAEFEPVLERAQRLFDELKGLPQVSPC